MTTIGRTAAVVAIVALMSAAQPTCVYACRCRPPEPPAQALTTAAAVFAGQVTTVAAPTKEGEAELVEVTFSVTRNWKGENRSTIVVTTPASSASCGIGFMQGREYLVYALENEGVLQTIACSRTAQLVLAGEDLAVLGAGSVPGSSTSEAAMPATLPATGAPGIAVPWSIEVVALLVILLGAAVRWRLFLSSLLTASSRTAAATRQHIARSSRRPRGQRTGNSPTGGTT